ncbi:hypothetical protein D3C87_244510 [compost metagenome]
MQKPLLILFLSITGVLIAQPPTMELNPNGFDPITVSIPEIRTERLIDATKTWAPDFNQRQKGYDITDVTSNSLTISAFKKNAFFYRNLGERFQYTIKYSMKITFYNGSYTLLFTVTDIYADDDKLVSYKIPDYFTASGQLKDGYSDLKPSLEKTVNNIVTSHYNYIINTQ